MASPHASSFICLPFSANEGVVHAYTVYFAVCLGSALIGALGAALFLVQVLRARTDQPHGSTSQRRILIWLAISDLCAVIGVVARSCYWLAYWRPKHLNQETYFSHHLPPAIGGAAVECWVFFWYLATYFWTFFFAVDIYNTKHGGKWKLWCSHLFTWLFCTLYVAGSVASLWACPPYTECTGDKVCVISHFLCTFGPIVIFMAALPLFYISTWKRMNKTANEAPVVDIWKQEKLVSRRKILSIILVFYICWFVNVIDGVILIVAHALFHGQGPGYPPPDLYRHIFDSTYIYIVWIIEAVLNPLQGFLNVIAYGGLCQWCYSEVKQRMRSRPVEPCVVSWSGEYIDVDFRVGRGNIRRSNRRKST